MASSTDLWVCILRHIIITHSHSHCTIMVDDPYPVATSHILSVLSLEAETRKSPEGMKQIDETLWSWPSNVRIHSYV